MKKIIIIIFVLFSAMALTTSCKKECPHLILDGDDAFITSCSVTGEFGETEGLILDEKIIVNLPIGTDVSTIAIAFELSENAIINVQPTEITDWTKAQEFHVTSANGEITKTYIVSVNVDTEVKEFSSVITLRTQEELNAFGALGYTKVGGITIDSDLTSSDQILDMSALSTIKQITGGFNVTKYVTCPNIELANLETVGRIGINADVEKVSFPKLEKVGDEFYIGHVKGEQPAGFLVMKTVSTPNLRHVGGTLNLNQLLVLESIKDFSNVEYVGGSLYAIGGLFDKMEGAFHKVTRIDGYCDLGPTKAFKSLEGFNIEEITGNLRLFVGYCSSLDELKKLKKIGGQLFLEGSDSKVSNTALKDFSALKDIDVSAIWIQRFNGVTSFDGLPIKANMGSVILKGFSEITSLNGLSALETADQLEITNFSKLSNLKGLDNLKSLGAYGLKLQSLSVTSFEGLGALANIEGQLFLDYMPFINSLEGMSKIKSVGGILTLSNFEKASVLPVFLFEEISSLVITGVKGITNLDGFINLKKITAGSLRIRECDKLVDLQGLRNLSSIEWDSSIDMVEFNKNLLLKDYSPIGVLLQGIVTQRNKWSCYNNGYNPTKTQILAGQFVGE